MYGLTSVKCELQQFSLCDVKLSVGSKSTCIFTVSLPLASRAVSSSFNGRQHYGEHLIVKTLACINYDESLLTLKHRCFVVVFVCFVFKPLHMFSLLYEYKQNFNFK